MLSVIAMLADGTIMFTLCSLAPGSSNCPVLQHFHPQRQAELLHLFSPRIENASTAATLSF